MSLLFDENYLTFLIAVSPFVFLVTLVPQLFLDFSNTGTKVYLEQKVLHLVKEKENLSQPTEASKAVFLHLPNAETF